MTGSIRQAPSSAAFGKSTITSAVGVSAREVEVAVNRTSEADPISWTVGGRVSRHQEGGAGGRLKT